MLPFVKKHKKITIVHFDAHVTLEKYAGNKFSHASALRRCLDFKNIFNIIWYKKYLEREVLYFNKNKSEKIFWAKIKRNGI